MYIASLKRKENIAEYLLYMWQIEDLIRANDLDIDKIINNIINKYNALDSSQRKNYIEWYESLIDMMRRENVTATGHLQLNKNVIIQLNDLHTMLLKDSKFSDYTAVYYKTLPFIVELRRKSNNENCNEIETCMTALYGLLLLKLQNKEISVNTNIAIKQISQFIALLSYYYKLDADDKLFEE